MEKKKTNAKVVATQPQDEKQQQELEAKPCKITRGEIVEHVRTIRQQFERTRNVYRGSMFNDCDMWNDLNPDRADTVDELAGWLNPKMKELYQVCCAADKNNETANLAHEMFFQCLTTAYHLGLFMGVIITADSPTEIDKAEKGLVFISAAQDWVSKE